MTERSNSYEAYMQFNNPEQNPWDRNTLSGYLTALTASNPIATDLDVESISFCYDQSPSYRRFHGIEHAEAMGQPDVPDELRELVAPIYSAEEAGAILAFAGLFHDVSYKQIDVLPNGTRAWSNELTQRIGSVARHTLLIEDGVSTFTTYINEQGQNDTMAQMVAHVFNVDIANGQGITNAQGGNEFDSALAAAKFLECKGVPHQHILAVVATIAATVPFRPAVEQDENGNMTDGHMGHIANRLSTLETRFNDTVRRPHWAEINAIMPLAVHLANRDISPFFTTRQLSAINSWRQKT